MTQKPSDELELHGLSVAHQEAHQIVQEAAASAKPFPGHAVAHGLEDWRIDTEPKSDPDAHLYIAQL
jgi:hypothetical protein